jgi:hypothetical protein
LVRFRNLEIFHGICFGWNGAPRNALRRRQSSEKEEKRVNKLLFAAVAATTLIATPAFAQYYVGGDPYYIGGGPSPGGVEVVPSGPYYWSNNEWVGGPGYCREVRERLVLPSGEVAYRMRRDCE